MVTRVRYEEDKPGVFCSKQTYDHPTNGGVFRVVLNTVEGKVSILQEDTGLEEASRWVQGLIKMKKEAKKLLKEVGVTISGETRNRLKKNENQ